MKTTLQLIGYAIISTAFYLLCTCGAKAADTNSIFSSIVSPGTVIDAGVFGTYAPSLGKSFNDRVGGGIELNYRTATNSILGYQLRAEYLNISKLEGTVWLPNGLVTLEKGFHVGSVTLTPFAEGGLAVDSKVHPYEIVGAGAAMGWRNLAFTVAAERWTGPANSFTTYNAMVSYTFRF